MPQKHTPATAVREGHYFETMEELRRGARAWRAFSLLVVTVWAATSLAGLATYWHLDRPTWVHAGPGLFDREPTDADKTFVAWEAAQGLLATNASTVGFDLEQAKRWMTDEAVQDLNLALAEFERANKVSYEASVAAQGTGTSFDELRHTVEAPEGSGASRRYPVLFEGTKTTLTGRNVPLESRPFRMRVWLVRVTESPANPFGLLVARFQRVDDDLAGAVNDVPPTVPKEAP